VRAEEREAWDQWWQGVGERELRKSLGLYDLDERFVLPVVTALRAGATVPELGRLLPRLREELGVGPNEDQDGECAVAAALWWDLSRSSRMRFGAI
jgi:hypothetical protein